MPSTTPTPTSPPFVKLAERVFMVPVEHNLQAHADEVRRAMATLSPGVVALEWPAGLEEGIERLGAELPRIAVLAWQTPAGRSLMLAGDPCDPLIEAWRLAREHGIPTALVDGAEGAAGDERLELPDEYAMRVLGAEAFASAVRDALPIRTPSLREWGMAVHLANISAGGKSVLFVGAMDRWRPLAALLTAMGDNPPPAPPVPPAPKWRVLPVAERELGKVIREIPYVTWLYESFRQAHGPEERFPVLRALQHILRRAADQYQEEFDERISMTEWRCLYQFARNLAVVRQHFHPRFYELVTAAKGTVDGDFGAIVFSEAASYPPNKSETDSDETGDGDDEQVRHRSLSIYADFDEGKVRLDHAYPFPEVREQYYIFRRRPPSREQRLLWRRSFGMDAWMGGGICSWPPEDEFVEKFFRLVRQRAFMQLTDNHSASEQFSSSVLDGLDLRETMRHWHEKKIYVKRERVPPGKIGPVVVIWRDMPVNHPGLWQTCLYAENQNESDIAFYARPIGREMVGPGITRTEYQGILSVFPAAHIPDVWGFHELRHLGTSARLLIASAILLSEERYVAVVAPTPPDLDLRMLARKHKRALIYLPLATFSKSLLKRARQCHILAGKQVRGWAGDYIPKD